jgi:hypothetical protein
LHQQFGIYYVAVQFIGDLANAEKHNFPYTVTKDKNIPQNYNEQITNGHRI